MKYTFRRKSQITGRKRDWIMDITMEGLQRYFDGAYVQDAFPELTPGEREFIITGITPEEWDEFVGDPTDA